ncbi:MAG: alpha/beta fold hydrolase [Alphaproteobacteria bacterium]|nr:alpha/beta fold hydrolase [Alphaproteobacteria bacterium]
MTDPAVDLPGERFAVEISDGAMAGWRWRRPRAPRLLFLHATGFCASAYKSTLRRAAARFDVYALDLRGHGRTRLPADPRRLKSWDVFARDVVAALDALAGEAPGPAWTLSGHSCGAVVSALAARGRADVAGLALIEPVTPPPGVALLARTPLWRLTGARSRLARGALARRALWPDREAVRASYARKPLFRRWAPGVLDDYLEDGLAPAAEGGVALACAPAWEAATFAAFAHDFWGAIAAAPAPVSVLGAVDPTTTLFGRAPARLKRLGAEIQFAAGSTHLLPFEAPDAAAAFLARAPRQPPS